MRINIIGLGYIGLPTAAMFAQSGADVVGVDYNERIVDTINQGSIHIEEPGLLEVVRKAVVDHKLVASTKPGEGDVFIIAVPTPNNKDALLGCDLHYVMAAVQSIMPYLRAGNVVIIESTIEPRTTEDYVKPVLEQAGFTIGQDLYLAHCPERVLPGQILHELVHNNRVVGGMTPLCAEKAADVYRLFVRGEIILTEVKTAEMSKLMENTFRDVNIALANELVKICNRLNINALDVIRIANKHPRVNLHTPGPGVGGHCLAVDPYFIYAKAPEEAVLIKQARDVNSSMPEYVVESVAKILKGDKSLPIAVFGVTYKPDVDDIRESPALKIVEKLRADGYTVRIHDPHVARPDYMTSDDALTGAGLLLCLAGHKVFKQMDTDKASKLMVRPLVFDTTGALTQLEKMEVVHYGNLYQYV